MVNLQNRKMPSLGTAWFYIGLSTLFTLLSWIQPLTGLILTPLAIALAATGILSIPRLPYYLAVLLSLGVGLIPAGGLYLFTKIPALSVAAFAIAPAIALFVLTIRRRHSRSAGIHWIALVLTLFYAGAAVLFIWQWKDGFSLPILKGLYNDAKDWFVKGFSDLPGQYTDLLEQAGLTEDALPDLFATFLATTPGLCIALIWSMAWFASVCLRWLFNHYVYGADRFAKWPVTMPKFFAWLFIISFIGQVIPLTNSLWLVPVIACNLYYILTPAFFIVGCRAVKERILQARGCGCLTFVLIGTVFTMPLAAFMLLAMTGAFRTITPVPPAPVFTPFPSDHSQGPQNPDDQGGNSQS